MNHRKPESGQHVLAIDDILVAQELRGPARPMHADRLLLRVDCPNQPNTCREVNRNFFLDRGSGLGGRDNLDHEIGSQLGVGVFVGRDVGGLNERQIGAEQSIWLAFKDESTLIYRSSLRHARRQSQRDAN